MAKHSPGPWSVERRYSNGCEIIPRIHCEKSKDRECGWIADVIGAPYLGYESTLHNARLIAAAPELLERLEKNLTLLIGLHGCDDLGDFYANRVSEELAATKSIIAKSTGG